MFEVAGVPLDVAKEALSLGGTETARKNKVYCCQGLCCRVIFIANKEA